MKNKKLFASLMAALMTLTVALALTTAPNEAKADNWVLHGADLAKGYALDVDAGFPDTIFRFHIPVNSMLEVNPFITFNYWGYGFGSYHSSHFSNTIGAQLKFGLWQSGNMGLSLNFDLGIGLYYLGDFTATFQIGGPELRFHYNFGSPKLALIFLFKMPIEVAMREHAWAWIPFIFNFGLEFNVIDKLNIFFAAGGGGVAVVGAGGSSYAHGHGEGHFGISYMF